MIECEFRCLLEQFMSIFGPTGFSIWNIRFGSFRGYTNNMYSFAYVFAMFAACPPAIVEAAAGRLHYGGWGGGKHSKNICK